MSSFNSVTLIGNLTREVEVKHTPHGTTISEFSLAVNEKRKKGEEYVDEVSFVDITLFGRTAELAGEYLSKGSKCLIQGRLHQDRWEKDGKKFNRLKVNGDKLVFLGAKKETEQEETHEEQYAGYGD